LAVKQTFIDTLFVIALINRRDKYHEQADEMAELYDGQPLLTTDAILLEIGNAMARAFKPEAAQVIEDFLTSEDVEVVRLTPELFERALALYKSRPDKEWGLVDCISFVVMQDAGVTDALTFDRHFAQAGFRALMRDQNSE
jgi:predicted nucleic acid-binding protein